MASFRYQGQRIVYTEFRGGPAGGRAPARQRPVILIHGLLIAQTMHEPLARALAARGNHVITIDLLGHGRSDRPRDMWRYSMTFFAEQVLALMDHLELEQAAVMGTSLGANTALEMADRAPERLQGMVIEMPVLDNALLACAIAFAPILIALTFGEPIMRVVQRSANAIPRERVGFYANVVLDVFRQDPGPGAAVLQGLFFGRIAPHRTERRRMRMPALVIGHRRDPVHPFSDAGMLASELQNARLLEADSLVELRVAPERLTDEIAAFLDECWAASGGRRRPARTSSGSRPTAARKRSRAANG